MEVIPAHNRHNTGPVVLVTQTGTLPHTCDTPKMSPQHSPPRPFPAQPGLWIQVGVAGSRSPSVPWGLATLPNRPREQGQFTPIQGTSSLTRT